VNGVSGGDAADGTIVSGVYTAPAALPSTNPVTITATSVEDPTKFGNFTLAVFTMTISPNPVTVFYGHTQQFTATVTGIANPVVGWFSNYQTIDANGLYTAPQLFQPNVTDTVYANLSGTPAASATVTLQFAPPVITSITPNGASANEPVTIAGQDFYGPTQVLFPGPNGSTLSAQIQSTALDQIMTTVPLGALSGSVSAQFVPAQGVTNTSNSLTFTRLPNIRIRAGARDLSSGESVQFAYRLLGASTPTTVNWRADMGSVSAAGRYKAPSVTQDSFATVTACLATTRSCDSTTLRILPLRIAPPAPVVDSGKLCSSTPYRAPKLLPTGQCLREEGRSHPAGYLLRQRIPYRRVECRLPRPREARSQTLPYQVVEGEATQSSAITASS
jgi:hypothetical protein